MGVSNTAFFSEDQWDLVLFPQGLSKLLVAFNVFGPDCSQFFGVQSLKRDSVTTNHGGKTPNSFIAQPEA